MVCLLSTQHQLSIFIFFVCISSIFLALSARKAFLNACTDPVLSIHLCLVFILP